MARSVLIVDDSAFIRRALREVFHGEPDLDVCGEAKYGREAIERARQLRPDLVVLDLSMPVMNGLDAAHALKRLMPQVSLIMYSAFGDRLVEHQARLVGISGVISKSEPPSALLNEARIVLTQTSALTSSHAGENER
jgi:DNA-binding NarL/FixJ family response regulator